MGGSAGSVVGPPERMGCLITPGLIADFEEGAPDPVMVAYEGRSGEWEMFNDTTSSSQTSVVEASGGTAMCDLYALHVRGSGYSSWGAGFGFSLVGSPMSARNEGVEALAAIAQDEKEGASYRNSFTWYQRAYGFPLADLRSRAYREFYFSPRRLWRLWNRVPGWRSVFHGLGALVTNMLGRTQPHALGLPKPPTTWPYRAVAESAGAPSSMGANRSM
jgi:hypothetical protein